MNIRFFVDMDGILVDFIAGACALHNQPNPYLTDEFRGNDNLASIFGLSNNDFYFNMGMGFWYNLPFTDDGIEILTMIESFLLPGDDIALLSTPVRTYGCMDGKMEWVRKNLPSYADRMIFAKNKYLCASPQAILIDDRVENCRSFVGRGGNSVIIPRVWNGQNWEWNTMANVKVNLQTIVKRLRERRM